MLCLLLACFRHRTASKVQVFKVFYFFIYNDLILYISKPIPITYGFSSLHGLYIYLFFVNIFCFQYLHRLFKRDHHKGQKYHEKQISLYAEFDRPNLLPFLRDSTHCPLEKVSKTVLWVT